MHKAVSILYAGLVVFSGCASESSKAVPVGPNPGIACGEALLRNPEFATIRDKIFLGNPATQPADILNNAEKATDVEKPVISAWLLARLDCFQQSQTWLQQRGFAKEYLSLYGDINASAVARTEDLLAGRLTYGQYARARHELVERAQIESEKLGRYLRAQ
jgi:hypothetical protein